MCILWFLRLCNSVLWFVNRDNMKVDGGWSHSYLELGSYHIIAEVLSYSNLCRTLFVSYCYGTSVQGDKVHNPKSKV